MSRRARAAIVTIATVALAAVSTGTAHAAPARTITDATKDVKVWAHDGPIPARFRAATDVTQVTYSRDTSRFYVKVRTRNVLPQQPGLAQQLHVGVYMAYSKQNHVYYRFWDMTGWTTGHTKSWMTRCRSGAPLLSYSSAEDWILISIPLRCIPRGKLLRHVTATMQVTRTVDGTQKYYGEDFTRWTSFRIRD